MHYGYCLTPAFFCGFQLVTEEGGFDIVCRERRWTKIALKMGFAPGKAVGSHLRAHYERILYPYNLFQSGSNLLVSNLYLRGFKILFFPPSASPCLCPLPVAPNRAARPVELADGALLGLLWVSCCLLRPKDGFVVTPASRSSFLITRADWRGCVHG